MFQKVITDLLHRGVNVIVDRYFYYGTACGCAAGLSLKFCLEKENGLIKPDKVYILTGQKPRKAINSPPEFPGLQKRVVEEFSRLTDCERIQPLQWNMDVAICT